MEKYKLVRVNPDQTRYTYPKLNGVSQKIAQGRAKQYEAFYKKQYKDIMESETPYQFLVIPCNLALKKPTPSENVWIVYNHLGEFVGWSDNEPVTKEDQTTGIVQRSKLSEYFEGKRL